jgi:hypothetical protein
MRKVSASRLARIGIPIVLIGGLTALEVCSRSVRDWTSQRPFTMNIAADFLVLTVTLFGVDVLLKRREEQQWRRLVGPAAKNWIDRALVLAAALRYYESEDPDVGGPGAVGKADRRCSRGVADRQIGALIPTTAGTGTTGCCRCRADQR